MHPSVLFRRCSPPVRSRTTLLSLLALLALTACEQATGPDENLEPLELSASLIDLEIFGDTARLRVYKNQGGERVLLREGITWSVDNPVIATVDDSGLITARNKGQARIIATSPIGVTHARVRVKKRRTLDISPKVDTIRAIGDSLKLAVQITNPSGKISSNAPVAWSSLNPEVAAVDAAGTVVARSAGDARIVAAAGNRADTAYIAVRGGAAVSIDPVSGTLEVGSTIRLEALATNTDGEALPGAEFSWSSSDPSVATVNQGKITTVGHGDVSITAALSGGSGGTASSSSSSTGAGRKADARLTILPRGRLAIRVSPRADTLEAAGEATQLLAAVTDRKTDEPMSDAFVTWTSLNSDVATVDSLGHVIAHAAGVALITAAAGTSVDTTTVFVGDPLSAIVEPGPSGPSPAELPKVRINTDYREPSGEVIHVNAGDNLQAAINAAEPGDIVELEAGATFTGNFELPAKDGTEWIVIRSSAMDRLPVEGERVGPADAEYMARIVSPNRERAIETRGAASHYRLMGLEITVARDQDESTAIVQFSGRVNNLILDRVYVHGHPDLDFRRCVILNADASAVIDSYISDCHSSGFDSQAILAWDTRGPLKIVNNYLEGAGENVMIGGARPADGVVPADIEIRGNYFFKPLSWKDPDRWSVKNLFEIKFGRRILVEGNVFENNWKDSQAGTAIVLKHAVDDGMDWTVAEDITFRNNLIRNARSGINLSSSDSPRMRRLLIENNRFEGIKHRAVVGLSHVTDAHFIRNTFVGAPGSEYNNMVVLDNGGLPGLVLERNLFGPARYGVGTGADEGIPYLEERAPGWRVENNAFSGRKGGNYPSGNYFPATLGAAQQLSGVGANMTELSTLVAGVAP